MNADRVMENFSISVDSIGIMEAEEARGRKSE